MKKILVALTVSILFFLKSFADPIIIWPSDMIQDRIQIQEILGHWWAASENDVMAEVNIEATQSNQFIQLVMTGKNHQVLVSGYLEVAKNSFSGQVMDVHSKDSTRILLYRSAHGFRIQFSGGQRTQTFDLVK